MSPFALTKSNPLSIRVGIGVDAHRRIEGWPLYLGGILIPVSFGLAAHSDGDVISHAILDALLGAANMGDKGELFPDTDPQYKDIRSTVLLERAMQLLRKSGYAVQNIDISVMCEEPRLMQYRESMKVALATALDIGIDRISVKATTLEGLGFTGRNEGIAAIATVLIEREDRR
jgi:2-C-methyl-D-erythritol 2,4-cyclodiphosphate synthase